MVRFTLLLVLGLGLGSPVPAQPPDLSSSNRLRPPVSACPVCDLWLEYESVFLRAKQEVGRLGHGVFYMHHSEDPEVIESLIRFAHERDGLARALETDPSLRIRLGRACGHAKSTTESVELEISTSARGVLALLRSPDPGTLGEIRKNAERATLGQVPAWY